MVPILAGLSGRGVKPLTWASCIIALLGVGLLEQGGAPPGVGDVWNLLSALFFGLQVLCCCLFLELHLPSAPAQSELFADTNTEACLAHITDTLCVNRSMFQPLDDLATG